MTEINVKIPDVFPSSPHYNQLIGTLNVFCSKKKILPCYYQFSELMDRHCAPDNRNIAELMRVMVEKFPELLPEYQKEQRNTEAHYYKVFNAVAVAKMI